MNDTLCDISKRLIRYTASLILKLAYGHRVTSMDDEYVQVSETAVTRTIESGSPGSMPVDIFPACLFSRSGLFFAADNLLLDSKIPADMDTWDGLQKKRSLSLQRCPEDGRHAL